MIARKVICDRCKKVVLDSEKEIKMPDAVDMLFGKADGVELGYAEVNIVRLDGKTTRTMHFCEDCYTIAVDAWNSKQ